MTDKSAPNSRERQSAASVFEQVSPTIQERAMEAYRIIQAMHEGALTPDEAMREWRRVRGEA